MLHFVGEEDNAPAIVAQYRDALAPGSYLAMSLGTTDGVDPDKIPRRPPARSRSEWMLGAVGHKN